MNLDSEGVFGGITDKKNSGSVVTRSGIMTFVDFKLRRTGLSTPASTIKIYQWYQTQLIRLIPDSLTDCAEA